MTQANARAVTQAKAPRNNRLRPARGLASGLLSVGTLLGAFSPVQAQTIPEGARIVSLGGSVTETVFALGAGHRVVAVDQSSLYPAEARALPQVGYFRTLSAEGVLSLKPDVVLASEGSGPPPVLEQLEAAGVRIVWVTDGSTPEAALEKIEVVAESLGLDAEGEALRRRVETELERASHLRSRVEDWPSALFVWGRGGGGGGVRVAGSGTGAATMLERAGAQNAAAAMNGYQPISAEALVLAAPEVIVTPQSTLDALGGADGLFALPGMSATPAGQNRRMVVVDLLAFIGFGPRVGAALNGFMADLHPLLSSPRE